MKPTVTTISTGYHTEEGEIVEFFYIEDGFGGKNFQIQTEAKIDLAEIKEFHLDFSERVNSFLGEQEVKVNYKVVK